MKLIVIILFVSFTAIIGQAEGCTGNFTYTNCKKNCATTCDPQPQYYVPCSNACQTGCVCKKGYVIDNFSGKNRCIFKSDCPKLEEKCRGNFTYTSCKTDCLKTCDPQLETFAICDFETCKGSGCVCKINYVLDRVSEKCMHEEDCPASQCKANTTYTLCTTNCRTTCPPQPETFAPCTSDCVGDGCVCQRGYVLDHISGNCIKEADCP